MSKIITIAVCIGLAFFSLPSTPIQAESYTKDITYENCELDNSFSSQVIAREQAKQKIFDELADTAEDWAKKYKFSFTRESDAPLFSCLVTINPVEEKADDGSFYYKAEAETKLAQVLQYIGAIRDEKFPTEDIAANRAAANQTLKEIEQIRIRLASPGDKDGTQAAYDSAVNRLHAADWYEKASFSLLAKEFDQAIDAYTKAIEFDPMLLTAYEKRGRLYLSHLKDKQKALADFVRTSHGYYNRGLDDYHSKNYQACLENLDNSIQWYSNSGDAYYQRAACHIGLGNQKEVKEDLIEAAKLDHEKAQALLTAKGIQW